MLQEKLPNRYGFKIVCKICFGANRKTQIAKPAPGECCPRHKDVWMPLRIHHISLEKIRPMPTVKNPIYRNFEQCQYNQQGKCREQEKCTYPHNQPELHVWRAEQAIQHPRPEPPPRSANRNPELCEAMCKKKFCRYGPSCYFAHSKVELTIWQIRYQKIKQDPETRGE